MNTWTPICTVDDIPCPGARQVRRADGSCIALFRTGAGAVHALLDRCPHKGGPLSQGLVFGEHVACPLHNWSIALVDGRAREPDVGCTPTFEVMVRDGQVHLRAADLAARAEALPPGCGGCPAEQA